MGGRKLYLKKEWEREQEQFNKVRAVSGLKPLEFKKRTCLRCDKEFISESVGNRMCINCKQIVRGRF